MNNLENGLKIKEKMEYLREKLNNSIMRNLENNSIEVRKSILIISQELDEIIVNYIKNFNQESKL